MVAGSAWTDPLAEITLGLRLQTHWGNKVPFGLYQDTACTIPATNDGHLVMAWRDELSGSGLVLKQSNTMLAPVLRFVGGVPVVRFDGDGDYLISDSVGISVRTLVSGCCAYSIPNTVGTLVSFTEAQILGRLYPDVNTWYTGSVNDPIIINRVNGVATNDNSPASTLKVCAGRAASMVDSVDGKVRMGYDLGFGFYFHGDVVSLIFLPSADDAERDQVEAYTGGLLN